MINFARTARRLTVATGLAASVVSCAEGPRAYDAGPVYSQSTQPEPNERIIGFRMQMVKSEFAAAGKKLAGCSAMRVATDDHQGQALKDMCITGAIEMSCQAAGYWQDLAGMPGSENIVPDPYAAERMSTQCPEKLDLIRKAVHSESMMAQHPGTRNVVIMPDSAPGY